LNIFGINNRKLAATSIMVKASTGSMSKKASIVPYYDDINEFIASVPMGQRTSDPFFYCLRLRENEGDSYKPPFRRGFYYVALLSSAERTRITFDNTSAGDLNAALIFQSPGLAWRIVPSF